MIPRFLAQITGWVLITITKGKMRGAMKEMIIIKLFQTYCDEDACGKAPPVAPGAVQKPGAVDAAEINRNSILLPVFEGKCLFSL